MKSMLIVSLFGISEKSSHNPNVILDPMVISLIIIYTLKKIVGRPYVWPQNSSSGDTVASDDLGRDKGASDDLADLGLGLGLSPRLDGHGGCDDRRSRDGSVDADTWVLLDDRVEAVHGVGRVGDDAPGAVRLDQTVAALDDVAVARLLLGLVVTCEETRSTIFERSI